MRFGEIAMFDTSRSNAELISYAVYLYTLKHVIIHSLKFFAFFVTGKHVADFGEHIALGISSHPRRLPHFAEHLA